MSIVLFEKMLFDIMQEDSDLPFAKILSAQFLRGTRSLLVPRRNSPPGLSPGTKEAKYKAIISVQGQRGRENRTFVQTR